MFPAGERGNADQEEHRNHQRDKDGVEVGRADREFARAQSVNEQRVECAEQHRGAGHDEQDVVGQQHGFAGEQGEASAEADFRCAPGKQGERAANHGDEKDENEDAALRVGGEGMDRGQNARTDEEGPEQR